MHLTSLFPEGEKFCPGKTTAGENSSMKITVPFLILQKKNQCPRPARNAEIFEGILTKIGVFVLVNFYDPKKITGKNSVPIL